MRLRTLLLTIVGIAAANTPMLSAPLPPGDWPVVWTLSAHADPQGDQNDPVYAAYRAAYTLVLEEHWNDAFKKLEEFTKKYPKSTYVVDAAYWSAYALRHIDYAKAKKAYEEFIKKYPKSSYYDDAVADLATISAESSLAGVYLPDSSGLVVHIPRIPTNIIGPNFKVEMGKLNDQMRRLKWHLRNVGRDIKGRYHYSYSIPDLREREELDPKTRLKLEALSALGEGKHDSKGFETLKTVALDRQQPVVLREEAIQVLGEYKEHPVSPILLDIAKNDTSEDLQVAAIEQLRESAKNKEEAVGTLTELFESLPGKREEQRASLLYEIADIGNDKAVEFLIKVARTDQDYDLRSDAVYYLGSIGGDKARTALYDILEGK